MIGLQPMTADWKRKDGRRKPLMGQVLSVEERYLAPAIQIECGAGPVFTDHPLW